MSESFKQASMFEYDVVLSKNKYMQGQLLHVYNATSQCEETRSFSDLLDASKFSEIKVISYVASPTLITNYLSKFKKAEFILGIDDYDYSLEPESRERNKGKLLCRFRLIKKVEQPLLHLSKLREKGLRSSMQSPFRVSGALLDHIENSF